MYIFHKSVVYFITVHKGADFKRMQVVLCYNSWIFMNLCHGYSMNDDDE